MCLSDFNPWQGYVDCWMRPEPTNTYNKLLCLQRQRYLDELRHNNLYFYSRLLIAVSVASFSILIWN